MEGELLSALNNVVRAALNGHTKSMNNKNGNDQEMNWAQKSKKRKIHVVLRRRVREYTE